VNAAYLVYDQQHTMELEEKMDPSISGTSLLLFGSGVFLSNFAYLIIHWFRDDSDLARTYACAITLLTLILVINIGIAIVRSSLSKNKSMVMLRSFLLGSSFECGLILSNVLFTPFSASVVTTVGLYVSALSFFHFSEFQSTAWWNPKSLSIDSFLLNHSEEYHIAMAVSWAEFFVEWLLFGMSKDFGWVACFGLGLVVMGETCRKLAMWTAQTNFNHVIEWKRRTDHILVTNGIYAWSRHPSYVGWFLWSIGTQLLLQNPVCFLGYAIVSWRFFRARIEDEEWALLNFFGQDYRDYQARVGTLLPGIKGVMLSARKK